MVMITAKLLVSVAPSDDAQHTAVLHETFSPVHDSPAAF